MWRISTGRPSRSERRCTIAVRKTPADGTYEITWARDGHTSEFKIEGAGTILKWPSNKPNTRTYEKIGEGHFRHVDEAYDPPLTHDIYLMDNGDYYSNLTWTPMGSTGAHGTFAPKE